MKDIEVKTVFKTLLNKKIYSFAPLLGGLSNVSYLINDAYVIRVPSDYIQPFNDYRLEKDILKLIEPLKISEKVIYFDAEKGIKISKFVHGAFLYKETPSDEQIRTSAKTIKKLHRAKLISSNNFDPLKRLETYRSSCLESKIDQRYEGKIVRAISSLLKKDDFVLCHNDLVQGNLLYKFDSVVIIDWEYAGMNSLYFDLASFISENNLVSSQKELFLKTYYGAKLNDLKRKRVDLFCHFSDILWYYWALMMAKEDSNPVYLEIAKIKKNRIDSNMFKK